MFLVHDAASYFVRNWRRNLACVWAPVDDVLILAVRRELTENKTADVTISSDFSEIGPRLRLHL